MNVPFACRLQPYIAFTALNTVWRLLDKNCETMLDVGCGEGKPMRFINRNGLFKTVGIDIFKPHLRRAELLRVYADVVLAHSAYLPFESKSFDVVLCLEVLEHLEKEKGEKLLYELERVARRQIILSSPAKEYVQNECDENPYQKHEHYWTPEEMKSKGFIVKGLGLAGSFGKKGIFNRLPKPIKPFKWIIWILAGFVTNFYPSMAGTMICIKTNKLIGCVRCKGASYARKRRLK